MTKPDPVKEAIGAVAEEVWALVGGPVSASPYDVRRDVLSSFASYFSCLASEGEFHEETFSGLHENIRLAVSRARGA